MEFADIDFTGVLSFRYGGYQDGLVCGFTTGMGVCMMMEVRKTLIRGLENVLFVSQLHGTSVQRAPATSMA